MGDWDLFLTYSACINCVVLAIWAPGCTSTSLSDMRSLHFTFWCFESLVGACASVWHCFDLSCLDFVYLDSSHYKLMGVSFGDVAVSDLPFVRTQLFSVFLGFGFCSAYVVCHGCQEFHSWTPYKAYLNPNLNPTWTQPEPRKAKPDRNLNPTRRTQLKSYKNPINILLKSY